MGRCFCTTYRATLKNSEASKYHKHDSCCGQLYVRVLCPRVSNQISTAGWYSTSLPLGDLEWEKREEREKKKKKRFNHNKWRKTLTISDMAYHRPSSYLLWAMQGTGEKENERQLNAEPYLEPPHISGVSCCFQTILIALEKKF